MKLKLSLLFGCVLASNIFAGIVYADPTPTSWTFNVNNHSGVWCGTASNNGFLFQVYACTAANPCTTDGHGGRLLGENEFNANSSSAPSITFSYEPPVGTARAQNYFMITATPAGTSATGSSCIKSAPTINEKIKNSNHRIKNSAPATRYFYYTYCIDALENLYKNPLTTFIINDGGPTTPLSFGIVDNYDPINDCPALPSSKALLNRHA